MYTQNLKKTILIAGCCLATSIYSDPFSKVIGWADVKGDNEVANTTIQTTTGGTGGSVVTITSGSDLVTKLSELKKKQKEGNSDPVIFKILGTLSRGSAPDMIAVQEVKNITFTGENNAKIKGFGLNIKKSYNIIIQNISFENCPDDGINIESMESHHVWVDHCNFSDLDINAAPDRTAATTENTDGSLDIKKEASYVTVSFCRFENHKKVMLIGHSNSAKSDKGHLKVTVHHCWFGYTYSRNTRNRFGQIHLFNNYYKDCSTMLKTEKVDGIYEHGYAIASTCEAQVVVENNYFENVVWPTVVSRPLGDPKWVATYGTTTNGKTHWTPTSGEDPGYITYRGENIQNPKPGTQILEEYKVWPLDQTNLDPNNWNPWKDYGYDDAKIATLLIPAADVPRVVKKAITGQETSIRCNFIVNNSGNLQSLITIPAVYDLNGRLLNVNPMRDLRANGAYLFKNYQSGKSNVVNELR